MSYRLGSWFVQRFGVMCQNHKSVPSVSHKSWEGVKAQCYSSIGDAGITGDHHRPSEVQWDFVRFIVLLNKFSWRYYRYTLKGINRYAEVGT